MVLGCLHETELNMIKWKDEWNKRLYLLGARKGRYISRSFFKPFHWIVCDFQNTHLIKIPIDEKKHLIFFFLILFWFCQWIDSLESLGIFTASSLVQIIFCKNRKGPRKELFHFFLWIRLLIYSNDSYKNLSTK